MEKLADACRNGDLAAIQAVPADELRRLCGKRDEDGRSLLHSAAASGNLDLVQFLIDHGAASSLNAVDEDGWTALTSAVSAGREGVVRCLLSLGAEVDAPTTSGRTPLHYACSKGQAAIAELLLKAGANAEAKDATGSRPLHRAAATGRLDLVRLLVETAKVKIDPANKQKETACMLAVKAGSLPVSVYLVSKGADVEAEDADGETPLSEAAKHGKLRDALVAVAKGELDVEDMIMRSR